MIRVPFEVTGEEGSFKVMVRAASMRRAEEDLRSRYPGGEVRLVFPLDASDFFAGNEKDETLESECLVLGTTEDAAPEASHPNPR
ncbi:MAG TPA: hypothetical protein VK869_06430 [Rubrobacteraceae bacterium]|nr:hypothetical protein [Rubrobacteraceae bacterium]